MNYEEEINRRGQRDLVVGTWNIRTLVENFGDLCACRKRKLVGDRDNLSEVVDRKLHGYTCGSFAEIWKYQWLEYRRPNGLVQMFV